MTIATRWVSGLAQGRAARLLGRCAGWLDRRFGFHSPAQMRAAASAVVLLGGVLALLLGQDANWDLRNYHLYNGYAWLHGRLGTDLAPAQLQSYFAPLLDAGQYLLMTGLPAPLAGLLMGMLHALAFVPLAAIAWRVLDGQPHRARLAPLLALAGLVTAAFLSEFGNSMADATTAPAVLGALACVLAAQRRQRVDGRALALWCLGGVLLGLAVACKLTNAVYALALAAAALAAGGRPQVRLAGLLLLAGSALAVFALLAAPWYLQVWHAFGNPLLPQFNSWFQAPLALPSSIMDDRWLPRGWGERLVWPLVFSFDPWRVSEVALLQVHWVVLYLLLAALLVRRLAGRALRVPKVASCAALLVFAACSYLLWQWLFSIHRYLVALELLAPLLLWELARRVFVPAFAVRAAGVLLAGCAAVALFGWADWGHEGWARRAFTVPAPAMSEPARSAVLLVGDEPQAWRVPFLPASAQYLGVATNFPATPAYRDEVKRRLQARAHWYAMLPVVVDKKSRRIDKMNAWAARLGWDRQPDCATLRWLVGHGLRARLDEAPGGCRLLPRAGTTMDVSGGDAAIRQQAQARLAAYGLALQASGCVRMASWVGAEEYPYQWCGVLPVKRR
jgi:hypothetical protein